MSGKEDYILRVVVAVVTLVVILIVVTSKRYRLFFVELLIRIPVVKLCCWRTSGRTIAIPTTDMINSVNSTSNAVNQTFVNLINQNT
jgi:hypothetical protein